MLGGADNPNGELPSYITGANTCPGNRKRHALELLPAERSGMVRPVCRCTERRSKRSLSPRSNFDVAFDDDGHQVKPTDGPTDGECCRCNQAV